MGARGGEVSSGREQIDDLLDGFVGTMISQFEAAVRTMLGVRTMVEAAIGQRAAQSLMEEKEEERDLDALEGQAVSVASAVTLQQSSVAHMPTAATEADNAVRSVIEAPKSSRLST